MFLWLAPMDGITDCPYRLIVKKVFDRYWNKKSNDELFYRTEFMSADGYMINPSRLIKHLIKTENETKLIAQIYWWNKDTLLKTSEDIQKKYPSFFWIELNIWCPSPKVMSCGAWAGMMKDKKQTLDIVRQLWQNCSLPFSIKTRSGLNENDKEDQFKFIVEASQYCSMITVHARTFSQSHTWSVDRDYIYRLRQEINPECKLIGNGGILSYDQALEKENAFSNEKIWIMIGQAAIWNPRIFTSHEPSKEDRITIAIEHTYLMAAYEVYLQHTRLSFPEESDQLLLNRKHLHIAKKYDPNSDEAYNIPTLDRHDYLFPMPTEALLNNYITQIKEQSKSGVSLINFGDFERDIDTIRTGIDIRKYLFNYISNIPNNKEIKKSLIATKRVPEIISILSNI